MRRLTHILVFTSLLLSFCASFAAAQSTSPATDTTDIGFWEKRDIYGFPFYMRVGDREEGTEVQMYSPFYWASDSPQSSASASPLHYEREDRENDSRTFVTPLYYSRRNQSDVMRIAPFYYLSETEHRKTEIISPFYVETETDRGEKTAIYGGLFWQRENKRQKTSISPFHFSVEDRKSKSSTSHLLYFWWEQETKKSAGSGLLPVYWYAHGKGADAEDSNLIIPPLLYYDKQAKNTSTEIFGPVYVSTEDRTKGESFKTIPLLLYWQNKARNNESWGLFPFFWSSSGDTESTTFLPLLFHTEDSAQRKMLLLGPFYADVEYPERDSGFGTTLGLYWWKKDREKQSYFSPLFYYSTEGEDRTIVGPPFYYSEEGGETTVAGPPFYYHEQADGSSALLLPGFYRYSSEHDSSLLLPGYYQRTTDEGKKSASPLHYYVGDEEQSRTYSPLFYYRSKKGSDDYTLLTPFYYGKVEGDNESTILPGYYYNRDEEGFTRAAPGYYYNRDAIGETTLLPGYYHRQGRRGETLAFPGYLRTRDKQGERELLLLRYREKTAGRTKTLWPGYYTSEDSEGASHLTPFFYYRSEFGSDDYTLLAPFYYRNIEGDASSRIFPGYYYNRDEDGETEVAPGYYYSRDAQGETLAAPFYYRRRTGEGSSEWFLLRYRDRIGDRTRELWPGYLNIEDRAGERIYTPFYYSNTSRDNPTDFSTCIGPYFKSVWGSEHTLIVAPIYFSHEKAGTGFNLALPVWYRSYDVNRTVDLFPGYVRSRARDQYLDLAPLFIWKRAPDNGSGQLLLGPYYNSYNESNDFKALLPLYYQSRGENYLSRTLLPVFYDRFESGSRFVWHFPLGFYTSDENSYNYNFAYLYTQERGEDYFGWRFLNSFYYREPDHTQITSLLYPLTYFRSNDATDTYYSSVLWPLFIAEKDEEHNETLNLAFWLFHQERNEKLDYHYLSLVWPLFVHERTGEDFSTWFLWRMYANQKLGEDENLSLFFLYDRQENSDQIKHSLFSLGEYSIDKRNGQTGFGCLFPYQYLWPLHFYWEREDGSYLREIALLAVMAEDRETASFRVYPNIYFDDRNKVVGTRSIDVLWPLFNRTWDAYSSSTRMLPFYYGASDPESSSTIVPLGLFFSFENREGHSRFQIPFYWDFSGPDYRNQVWFPIYWNFRDAESESTYLALWHSYRDSRIEKERLYPFYYYDKTEDYLEEDFLPFYSREIDKRLDREYLLTWGYYHKRQGARHTYGIPPLPVWWNEDESTGAGEGYTPFPLVWWGNNDRESYHSFVPLYFYRRNKLTDSRSFYSIPFIYASDARDTTYAFPPALSWYNRGAGERDWQLRVLFPLLWAGQEREESYSGFLPVFWHHRNESDDSSWLWALNYYHRNSPESFLQYFAPLWRYESFRGDWQFSMLLPPTNFSRFREYENSTILPLFWYQQDYPRSGEEATKLWVFPTIWWKKNAEESVAAFFPLFYKHQADKEFSLQILPLYYSYDRESTAAHFAPLYFSSQDNSGNNWRVIPPLLYYSRYNRVGDSYDDDFVFGPFWSLEDEEDYSFWIFPLFRYYNSQKPDSNRWNLFASLLWIERDEDKFSLVSPLWIEKRDRDRVERAMLIPPLYQKYNPNDMWGDGVHCLACWPMVFDSRNDFYTVFPFYWQFGSEDKLTRFLIPPFYASSVEADSESSLYGLVWYESKDREGDFRTVLGLWYDGSDVGEDSEYNVLFPLYWNFREGAEEQTITPIYTEFKSAGKTTTTYLLWIETYDAETETEGSGLLPFFYRSSSPDGSYFSILGDMFGYERKQDRKRIFLFWIPVEI